MHKQKFLIVGGGLGDIPLIKAAQKLGYEVTTLSTRINSIAHKYSDKYINADYTNKNEVLNIVKKEKFDAISPCTNDFSARVCSYVAESLNYSGHDTYKNSLTLHKKDLFREFTNANNILAPKAKSFIDIQTALDFIKNISYQMIIKPSDSTSGKGISKIEDDDANEDLIKKLKYALANSNSKTILIEEYIEGTNHGFSTLIKDSKVIFHFIDEEHYYLNKYMVSGASSHPDIKKITINTLINEIEKIASLLKLKDGIVHVQFILKNDIPYILEICRRIPGDLYIDLVKYSTGVDYPSCIVKAFAGLNFINNCKKDEERFITRHCIMSNKSGVLENITFDKSIEKKIIKNVTLMKPLEELHDTLNQKLGIVFIEYKNKEDKLNFVNKLNELIYLQLKNN